MVILAVDVALRVTTPVPLTKLVVNEIILDILPATQSLLKSSLITEMLIDVIEADDGFCLYPPMAVIVNIAGIKISLMRHRAVGIETFFRSLGNKLHDRLNLRKHFLVTEHKGCLVHKP